METVKQCLNTFCAALGSKVSVVKTKVFFSRNVHISRAQDISSVAGFPVQMILVATWGFLYFILGKPGQLSLHWWKE